jgi:signal transduction histidine kinase
MGAQSNTPKNTWGVEAFADFVAILSQGQNNLSHEACIRTHHGNTKYILQQISVMPGYEDTWDRVLVADVDITEIKKIENMLKEYQNHLEDIIRRRSSQLIKAEAKTRQTLKNEQKLSRALQENIEERIEYTRSLVHEIKTPLTPLMVCSEALVKIIKTAPELSLAKNINSGAANLSKIIEELLDLAKSEVGSLTLKCRIIEPSRLLREVVSYIIPMVKEKGLNLSVEIPAELPKLRADRSRLIQVFLNLFDNAIKYTQPGGTVSCRAATQGQWDRVDINDTGPGIDVERQKLLFQPYKRFGASQYRVGGLGLGLVLAKDIVELHNGKISVTSKKGVGSTFTVLLPHI